MLGEFFETVSPPHQSVRYVYFLSCTSTHLTPPVSQFGLYLLLLSFRYFSISLSLFPFPLFLLSGAAGGRGTMRQSILLSLAIYIRTTFKHSYRMAHKATHTPRIDPQNSVTPQRVCFQNRTTRFRTALDETFRTMLSLLGACALRAAGYLGFEIGSRGGRGGCFLSPCTVQLLQYLVEKKDIRLLDQSRCEGYPLALPPGKIHHLRFLQGDHAEP